MTGEDRAAALPQVTEQIGRVEDVFGTAKDNEA